MLLNDVLIALELLSAAVVVAVIFPLLDIASMMRSSALRRRWHLLTFMLACVVVLMLTVAVMVRETPDSVNVGIAGSYALGAAFVMSVVRLMRRTTREALRLDALEEAAFTDPLTGLANRRRFDERISDEVRRARRTGSPLSLFVLDVDHFKRVNDGHGHSVGDLVLRQVASVIAARSRHTDTACRVGGEEFVVIVPGLGGAFAAATAERLRRAVGETGTPHDGGADILVTASLGLATLRPSETADMLFRRADAALYDAKRGGRDRTGVAA